MRVLCYRNYRNVMMKKYSNKDSSFTLNSISSLVTSLEIASLTPLIAIDDKFKAPSCLNCFVVLENYNLNKKLHELIMLEMVQIAVV